MGQDTWEEIDVGEAGVDYGWNIREGACANGSTTRCSPNNPPPPQLTDPVFSYPHNSVVPGTQSRGCNSITGGAFVPNGLWPPEFDSSFLFADFVCGSIFRLARDGSGWRVSDFVRELGSSSAVTLTFGPPSSPQALYYTTYSGGGQVRRIVYAGPEQRLAAVSAASYAVGAALAPESITSVYRPGFQGVQLEAPPPPLPQSLAGVTVMVRDSAGVDRPASLYFVSPDLVNMVIPAGTALGTAAITVRSDGTVTARGAVRVEATAPSVFTANRDGRGVPAALVIRRDQPARVVFQCGALAGSCVPAPIDLGPEGGTVLVLFGSGIRGRASLDDVTVIIGGVRIAVEYAGSQSEFPGLDQINAVIPQALAGRGEVEVTVTVGNKSANPVRILVR